MRSDDQKGTPPWGTWLVLYEETDFKVKRIEVLQGCRLSYQKHSMREEHWHVVRGEAKATLDGRHQRLRKGDSLFIEREALHRIENAGTETLVFIEVQHGDYFGEDDIVRVEDDYGRL
jgi:mannose-6-phosphate isomerase